MTDDKYSIGSSIGRLLTGTGQSTAGLASDVLFILMSVVGVLLAMIFSGISGGLLVVALDAGRMVSGPINGVFEVMIQFALSILLILPAFAGAANMRFLAYPEDTDEGIIDFFGLNCYKFSSRILLLLPPGLMLFWFKEKALNPADLGLLHTVIVGFALLSLLYRCLVYGIATGQKYAPGEFSHEVPKRLKHFFDIVSIVGFGFLYGAFEYILLEGFFPGIASSLYAIPSPLFILESGALSVLAIITAISASLLVAPTGYWVISRRERFIDGFWNGMLALEPLARMAHSGIRTTAELVIGLAGLLLIHFGRTVAYVLLLPPDE